MNTIKVDGTGNVEQRVGALEQAVNYGEVVLPFTVVGDVEGTDGGAPGPAGPPGPAGATGPTGPAGPGVAPGGLTGQVLAKQSTTNYDTIWVTGGGGGGASVHVGATAPVSPAVGDLWWRSDPDGALFVFYNDGNSQQWVPATPTIKGDPGPSAAILSGVGPPAGAVGVPGDYYLDTASDTLYGPKQGPESTLAGSGAVGGGAGAYTIGVHLRALRAGRLTALRFYRVSTDTTTTSRTLRIWPQGGGAVLASATTTETPSTNGWITATLAVPLVVTAGQEVRVAYDTPGTAHAETSPLPTSVAPDLTIVEACFSIAGTGIYPDGNHPSSHYWADVVFEPDWPVALIGLPPGGVAYRHVQASAATTWSITHGLGFRPNVAAVDSTGREIVPGAVDYTSATAVTLTFSAAVGGEAYLS